MNLEMIEAGWLSLLPPLIAITLALISKEVYSSLFLGVLTGMGVYCFLTGGNVLQAVTYAFDMIAAKIGENGYMIIFLVLLGSLVVVVTRSGGSNAYGQWAGKRIKNKVSAKLATALLGLLIFVDDGFNCLTVGTVMRPITDKCRISREKLAYLLDATAAPICIIAPISSWAVAVASEVEEAGGLNAFVRTIPYNLYAILTIVMVFYLSITDFDFGPMKKAEENKSSDSAEVQKEEDGVKKGSVPDLVVPILTLIICSILGMAYVGGYFSGRPFAEAIGENPTAGLTLGTFAALLVAMAMYIPRRLMSLREFMTGVIDGIKTMIPALMILILAWALGGVCREMIGTGLFVSNFVTTANLSLSFLPAVVFAVAAFHGDGMGDFRHSAAHCIHDLCGDRGRGCADSVSGGHVGRFRVRGPLFSHFRHHHPGIHRGPVRASETCGNPAALCDPGGGGMLRRVSGSWVYAKSLDHRSRSGLAAVSGVWCGPFYGEAMEPLTFQSGK